jgi:hypothetical protein
MTDPAWTELDLPRPPSVVIEHQVDGLRDFDVVTLARGDGGEWSGARHAQTLPSGMSADDLIPRNFLESIERKCRLEPPIWRYGQNFFTSVSFRLPNCCVSKAHGT